MSLTSPNFKLLTVENESESSSELKPLEKDSSFYSLRKGRKLVKVALAELLNTGQTYSQPQVLAYIRPKIPPEFCIRQNLLMTESDRRERKTDKRFNRQQELGQRAESGLVRLLSYAIDQLRRNDYVQTKRGEGTARTDWLVWATPRGLEYFRSTEWHEYCRSSRATAPVPLGSKVKKKSFKRMEPLRVKIIPDTLRDLVLAAAGKARVSPAEWVRDRCRLIANVELGIHHLTGTRDPRIVSDHENERPTESEVAAGQDAAGQAGNAVIPVQ